MPQPPSSGEATGGPVQPGPLLLSVSGLGRLTACEEKFLRSRETPDDGRKSDAMALGTLMHTLIQTDMLRQDWRQAWQAALDEEQAGLPEPGSWEPPEIYQRADWLMERYETHYAGEALTTITVEVPFDLELPGSPDVRIRGYIDGLAHAGPGKFNNGHVLPEGLVLVELKTMGKWGKADRAQWESQVHCYLWAARQLGLPVTGCIFRAVFTGQWKTEEGEVYKSGPRKGQAKGYHPPADSFRDVWVPWSQVEEDKMLRDFRNAGTRGLYLIDHPDEALRTLGEACGWCPFKRDCLGL